MLIQDNLNTHGPGAFYELFGAEEVRPLAKRFGIHWTLKKASWLNMVEAEPSVMSKQCLARRIATRGEPSREVATWARRRNRESAKIK